MSARLATRLTVLVLSTLVSLLVAELLTRLVLPAPTSIELKDRLSPDEVKTVNFFSDEKRSLYILRNGRWTLRPNSIVHIRNHAFTREDSYLEVNSLGFRGPEIAAKSHPRVLFLGDSITLAEYLPEDKTFVRLIERKASELHAPIEVINAAANAIGIEDHLAVLRDHIDQLSVDIVVLDYFLNDASVCCAMLVPPPPALLRWSSFGTHLYRSFVRLGFSDQLARGLTPEMIAWAEEFRATPFPQSPGTTATEHERFAKLAARNFSNWGNSWTTGSWQKVERVMAEMRALTHERNIPLLLVAFPLSHQVASPTPHVFPQNRLRAIAESLELPLLDLLPVLRERFYPDIQEAFVDDCHLTAVGNGAVADALYPFIHRVLTNDDPVPQKALIGDDRYDSLHRITRGSR